MHLFLLIFSVSFCFADPFYYGLNSNNHEKIQSLRLFGIMGESANINKQWIKLQTTFTHNNQILKLTKIKNLCITLEQISNQKLTQICLEKPKIIQGKQCKN